MDKMEINWGGFLKIAVESYPKEACGFLFSNKPYSSEEEWFVLPVKNISQQPQEEWIPDKKDMQRIKSKAIKLGLVKIGNIHTHPYLEEVDKDSTNFKIAGMPSDKDLNFARRFNDIVRIILLCDKETIYTCYVHDKFGNKIDICLESKGGIK